MASIQEYLDLIKNAIYGKDVRQAIHDGIQQCYYDGKAGSTDLEARQRLDSAEGSITSLGSRMSIAENDIDVLDSRVDQIVAPSGEAPSAAEVSDARIGADGVTYSNLGTAIRTQFSDVKGNLFSYLDGSYQMIPNIIDMESKVQVAVPYLYKAKLNYNTGEEETELSGKMWISKFIPVSYANELSLTAGYSCRVYYYDSDKTFIALRTLGDGATDVDINTTDNASFYRFYIYKTNWDVISNVVIAEGAYSLKKTYGLIADLGDLVSTFSASIQDGDIECKWEAGHVGVDGKNSSFNSDKRIRTARFIKCLGSANDYFVSADVGYDIAIVKYTLDGTFVEHSGFLSYGELKHLPNGYKYRFVARKSVEAAYSSISEISDHIHVYVGLDDKITRISRGGISSSTGDAYENNTRLRTNFIKVKAGTVIVPYVFGMPIIYVYDDSFNYIGTHATLGFESGFDVRANAITILSDCIIRIAYHFYSDFWDYFDSDDERISTLSIIPPDYSVPYYIKDAVDKVLVKTIQRSNLRFTLATDVHEYFYHDYSHVYCAELTSKYLINLGDMMSIPRDDLTDHIRVESRHVAAYVKSAVPVVLSKGNHEITALGDAEASDGYTNRMWVNGFQKPLERPIYKHPENLDWVGCYYIDDEEYKTRIVNVNTFSIKGGHNIGRGQMIWLYNDAFDLSDKDNESEWSVIVVSHSPIIDNLTIGEPTATDEEKILRQILATLTQKVNYVDAELIASEYDGLVFQRDLSDTKFKLIAYLCGHTHFDSVNAGDGFLHITTTCDHPVSDHDGYRRTFDSINEYAFEVIEVQDSALSFNRIGVGKDRLIHDEYEVLTSGQTKTLTTQVTSPTWASSDTSVVRVSNGVVSYIGSGFATVSAKGDTEEYWCIKTI